MKIIVAGFPKTGTKTLNAALTELGFKCYDYIENYVFLGNEWDKIVDEGGSLEDLRKMFEDVDAVMDIPGCVFWEEIHQAFPDAKILFNQRDSEDEWFNSFNKHIQTNMSLLIALIIRCSPRLYFMNKWGNKMAKAAFGVDFKQNWSGGCSFSELLVRKAYRKHNTYVLEKAPKDKLHMVDFKKGWEPLCQFLGVSVPKTPFPHKNKKGSVLKESLETDKFLIKAQREGLICASIFIGLVAFSAYKFVSFAYSTHTFYETYVEPLYKLRSLLDKFHNVHH